MNIDTLKMPSGAYRSAKVSDIVKMLRADHVTHIQTHRGTIAIRPGRRAFNQRRIGDTHPVKSEKGWTVDRAVAGITDRQQSKWFKRDEQRRLIRTVLYFLNGKHHIWQATDDVLWWANQAQRDGYVLAVNGSEVLIEYEMPAGTSALVLCEGVGDTLERKVNIAHRALPQEWIDRIHDQGGAHYWIGKGQRMTHAMPLPPRTLKLGKGETRVDVSKPLPAGQERTNVRF